jgi:chromosome segregation protein
LFLKSLEILGFKSFADKTKIEFADGVATLVGANGSGKSNVVDAMKWVLGEQSPRAIRAETMGDIIFAGSESRKPMSLCEVTLTVSNEDKVLALGLPEISIRRRLYRSGESESYINGNVVRLREIRELFFDTGIGKSAYSIMEQGRIDQLLSTKTEERRSVFEEAAGITRFRARGEEAKKKLERTEENMRQIEGILDEVRRRYSSLQGQAESAEAYRKLREEVFEVELEIQLQRLKDLREAKKEHEGRLAEKNEAREELRHAIDQGRAVIAHQTENVNAMESRLLVAHKEVYRIETEKGLRENQIRILRERVTELGRSVERDKVRHEEATRGLGDCDAAIKEVQRALAELERRVAEAERSLNTFLLEMDGLEKRTKANDEEILKNESATGNLDVRMDGLRSELRAITDEAVIALDARLKEAGYSSAERHTVEASIEEAIQSLRIHVLGKVAILEDALQVGEAGRGAVAHATIASLPSSLEKVASLEQLLLRYKSLAPPFLDEFLAPQGIISRKRSIDQEIDQVAREVSDLRDRSQRLSRENAGLRLKVEEYRKTLAGLRVELARQEVQKADLMADHRRLLRQRTERQSLHAKVKERIEQTQLKGTEADQKIALMEKECARLHSEGQDAQLALSGVEGRISAQKREALAREKDLEEKNALLLRLQSEIEHAQISAAQIRTEIRDVRLSFRERFSRDLSQYETRIPDIAASRDPRTRLTELREETRRLGQVNLMAPEEFEEVKNRFDFVKAQWGDLSRARDDMRRVTTAIRTGSTEFFLATFNNVKTTFDAVFRRLFGGGSADLCLSNPESPLDSGIEILAQPPGKKMENINLLSGGERSLTGAALLFAVLMVKPSPFCVLDEVDAALDEENVTRLDVLLKEFSAKTQFLVISHNKRTVARTDVLYGVAMEEPGVSKLVSVRVENNDQGRTFPLASWPKGDSENEVL